MVVRSLNSIADLEGIFAEEIAHVESREDGIPQERRRIVNPQRGKIYFPANEKLE